MEAKLDSDAARMKRGRKKVLQVQHGTSEVKFTVRLDESISFRRKTRLVKVVERRCGEGNAKLKQSLRLIDRNRRCYKAVSYTHLTLPTKRIV